MTRYYTADTKSYLREVMQLTRSLVIHMPAVADMMNRELELDGYTIEDDPEEWRYYQHLAGRYHRADSTMTINSFDTHESITFNRENLEIHTRTRRNYRRLSKYYRRLVERYPEQEMLVRGILTPTEPEEAVDAREGAILNYNDTYVESQEHELIERLEEWIVKFLDRWSNEAYAQTDELYTPARLGILFAYIPNAIIHIRHQLQGTAQAHSFYIRQQLASYGELDQYLAGLRFEQIHYLYRNARYLLHHAGTKHTLKELVDNLAEPMRIPLAAHEIRQRISPITGMISDSQDELPAIDEPIESDEEGKDLIEEFRPQPSTQRQILTSHTLGYQDSTQDLDFAADLEADLAIDNERVWEDQGDEIARSIRLHNRSIVPSKLIDSVVEDRSNVQVYRYEDIVLVNWFDLAERGIYERRSLMVDPISREEVLLTMLDLLIVFLYATNRQYGFELEEIPDLYLLGVKKDDAPSREKLSELTDLRFVENHELIDQEISYYREEFPETPTSIISFERFVEYNEEISRFRKRQYYHYTQGEDHHRQGEMEAIAAYFWQDRLLKLSKLGEFENYFESIGYRIDQVNDSVNLELIASHVLEEATGLGSEDRTEFERAQRSLLGILRRLSSYSVQFGRDLISQGQYLIDPRAIRHSPRGRSQASEHYAMYPINPIETDSKAYKVFESEMELPFGEISQLRQKKSFEHKLDMEVDPYKERIKYIPVTNRAVVTLSVEKKSVT